MRMSITQTATRNVRQARPKPKYVARAKVGNGWQTIGAAWPFRSGEDGLSIQINTIPLNWDGRFTLIVPLSNEDVPELGREPEPGED